METIRVTLDGGTFFTALTDGQTWNGFQCPYFTKEEGLKIVDYVQHDGITYNEDIDSFIEFDACDIHNKDNYTYIYPIMIGEAQYYAIGHGGWTWDVE